MTLQDSIIGRTILQELQDYDSSWRTHDRIDLYVDAATGDDANEGTEDAPLASLVEAERRIPLVVDHPVAIHVAPHTGDGYAPPTFRQRIVSGAIDVVATEFNELFTGTVLAGSNHTKVITSGLTENEFRGKTIEMTSGALKGFRRTLNENSTTELVPSAPFPTNNPVYGNIAPGDTFRIIEPAVTIQFPLPTGGVSDWQLVAGESPIVKGGPFDGTMNVESEVTLVGLRIRGQAELGFHSLRIRSGAVTSFAGCEFASLSNVGLFAGTFRVGVARLLQDDSGTNQTWERLPAGKRAGYTDHSWVGWGVTSDTNVLVTRMVSALYYGLVAPSLLVFGGYNNVRAANIHTGGILAYGNIENGLCELHINGKMYLPDLRVLINSSGAGISAKGHVIMTVQSATITAATVGVEMTLGARGNVHSEVSITSAVGLRANTGARMETGSIALTATGAEIEVGNTPTVGTLAVDLASVGDYIAEPDGSIVQRVS